MKKAIGIATLLLALAACNKIETQNQPIDNAEAIPFSATIRLENAATRALTESGSTITSTWKTGEKVALIHNGVNDEMVVSSVSGSSATITGIITGSPSDGEAVTIIYPSSAADGTTGSIKNDLLYAQNGLLTGTGSISESFDARKGTGNLKIDGTATLSGSVSLTNQFAIFKFTIRGADGTTVISAKPLTITIDSQDYVITPATATDVLYAALPAVSGEKVSFYATDGSDRTYTYAKLSTSFDAGNYYQSTLKMREYVDLGITVGGKKIYWATCNIGAASETDYGDYFAWGETATKQDYSWSTYFDNPSGDGKTFIKYDPEGKKQMLDLEDDAASVNWGGNWRIPTPDEINALLALPNEKVTNYEGSNVNGYKFTGSNGKTIFLPFAGYRQDTKLSSVGSSGFYWSSTLWYTPNYAWRLYLYSGDIGNNTTSRFFGQSIRPVTE